MSCAFRKVGGGSEGSDSDIGGGFEAGDSGGGGNEGCGSGGGGGMVEMAMTVTLAAADCKSNQTNSLLQIFPCLFFLFFQFHDLHFLVIKTCWIYCAILFSAVIFLTDSFVCR